MKDFSEFAKPVSEMMFWTDFERTNETHFWSPLKKVFVKPDVDEKMGNRIVFKCHSSKKFTWRMILCGSFKFINVLLECLEKISWHGFGLW